MEDEHRLHRQFKEQHYRGEWFHFSGFLKDWVEEWHKRYTIKTILEQKFKVRASVPRLYQEVENVI